MLQPREGGGRNERKNESKAMGRYVNNVNQLPRGNRALTQRPVYGGGGGGKFIDKQ